MTFLPRLRHELTDALRERHIKRLYHDHATSTARMLEFPAWRIGGTAWDRLLAKRTILRKEITSSTRTRPRAVDLGGPATVTELASRGKTATAAVQPGESIPGRSLSGRWVLAGAAILIAGAVAAWYTGSSVDPSARARAEWVALHPRVAGHGVGLR